MNTYVFIIHMPACRCKGSRQQDRRHVVGTVREKSVFFHYFSVKGAWGLLTERLKALLSPSVTIEEDFKGVCSLYTVHCTLYTLPIFDMNHEDSGVVDEFYDLLVHLDDQYISHVCVQIKVPRLLEDERM